MFRAPHYGPWDLRTRRAPILSLYFGTRCMHILVLVPRVGPRQLRVCVHVYTHTDRRQTDRETERERERERARGGGRARGRGKNVGRYVRGAGEREEEAGT